MFEINKAIIHEELEIKKNVDGSYDKNRTP